MNKWWQASLVVMAMLAGQALAQEERVLLVRGLAAAQVHEFEMGKCRVRATGHEAILDQGTVHFTLTDSSCGERSGAVSLNEDSADLPAGMVEDIVRAMRGASAKHPVEIRLTI
jgi:hypothetical protein